MRFYRFLSDEPARISVINLLQPASRAVTPRYGEVQIDYQVVSCLLHSLLLRRAAVLTTGGAVGGWMYPRLLRSGAA